ncbi:hypothetical protein CVCC1112_2715 [Paenarthrobacter nicotinovorans]|nr:hypothetical protein CVCC1112_2715 [Paenarthrobacter nicotinovorans]
MAGLPGTGLVINQPTPDDLVLWLIPAVITAWLVRDAGHCHTQSS